MVNDLGIMTWKANKLLHYQQELQAVLDIRK